MPKPKPFKVPEVNLNGVAENAISNELDSAKAKGHLELVCPRCTFAEMFSGETRLDAHIKARKAGWTLDGILCPSCSVIVAPIQ